MHLVMQGSIDEDNGIRSLNHFYDPIKNRGLVLLESKPEYQELAAIGYAAHAEWSSSKEWAKNTSLQAGILSSLTAGFLKSYFSSEDDYSWDRAIYEYTWGDKSRGLLALGHILHLIEDATVPDHTRNDPHPPILDFGSPYEHWASQFSPINLELLNGLLVNQQRPVLIGTLGDYFDKTALYSNTNFFSKDTIFGEDYSDPKVKFEGVERLSDGIAYQFGYGFVYGEKVHLFRIELIPNWEDNTFKRIYRLDDKDNLILSDYWSHLSKQAVLNGAGVVKLFFDEVAKEKQTKTLYEKNRSWFEKMVDKSREGIFKVANVLYGITVPYNLETGGESAVTNQTASDRGVSSQPVETLLAQTAPTAPQSKNKTTEIGAAVENNQNSVWPQPRPAVPQPLAPQLKAPQAPSVELPLGQDNSPIVSGPSGGVNGGAPLNSPSNPSSAVSSQTQSQNQNQAQNSQAAGQDTTPPDAAIAVSECENSLSSSGCLIATTTLNISWSSGASDLDHYAVECLKNSSACSGFSVTANATSISFAADDGATYTFRAKALDTAGNESAYAEKEVEVNLRPVIINEIAWAGTAASTAADEWIELYNRASKSVNLSGWILRSVTDDKPYLHLSGGVSAHGYYLIERTDDNTVSDVAADFIASFGSGTGRGLVDTGEELALEYASTTIDATPTVNTCGLNQWCAGGSDQRLTMERVDPDLVGTDADSWASNNAIIRNGKSTDGIALNGTPKARNSQSYYISRTNNLAASKTIIKAKSPYFIDQYGLTIPSGLTLTIDPGVVIKFAANTSDLIIDGTLKAVGSAAEPIVFTSFYDDEYGGDLNSDGAASAPAPGNWRSVIFESSSQNSELSYVRVRYGGMRFSGQDRGGVLVDIRNTSPTVSNSIFEQSYQDGLKLINASSTLSGSTIQKNNAAASAYGVYVKGGAPVIEGNTFSQNPWGLAIESGSRVEVRNNTFSNNSVGAISSFGSVPEFSENTASGNAINGISLSGSLNSDYVFPKDLPYVIDGTLTLPQGKNFTVPAGVIFKGKSSSAIIGIEGVLHIQGQVSQPVLFTSWADDDYGGDTNNDGSAAVPHTGDWGSISFYASAGGSALENTIIRYAGAAAGSSALSLNAAVMDASNITVEKNRGSGIGLNNASSTLTGITVRDNNDAAIGDQYGLLLENNSKVLLANAVFRNNKVGVYVTGGSVLINGGGIDIDDSNITKTIPSGLLP